MNALAHQVLVFHVEEIEFYRHIALAQIHFLTMG